jgi:hypothetical protein
MHPASDLTERKAVITVVARSGTYIARAAGYGVTASCTISERYAAQNCALKLKYGRPAHELLPRKPWPEHGITLVESPGSAGTIWIATWHATTP